MPYKVDMYKVLDTCFKLYLHLTVYENNKVRELNTVEINYKNTIINKITDKFGGVTIEQKCGRYKRKEGIVETDNEIITVYTDKFIEPFQFFEKLIEDIKDRLSQDSVALVVKEYDNSECMYII